MDAISVDSNDDDGHSEFKLVPLEQLSQEYTEKSTKRNELYYASRNDIEAARTLSQLRRERPATDDFAGGPHHYDPTLDPEMYQNNCYLCFTKTHQEYPRFYGILAQFLGHSQFDTIIDAMYQAFDLFINPGTIERVEMTRAKIKEHILHHMNEPLVEYYVQLEQYKTTRNLLKDNCVQTNGNGEYLFDYKAIATLEKINAKIISLYKEKPQEALFANTELNIGGGGVDG